MNLETYEKKRLGRIASLRELIHEIHSYPIGHKADQLIKDHNKAIARYTAKIVSIKESQNYEGYKKAHPSGRANEIYSSSDSKDTKSKGNIQSRVSSMNGGRKEVDHGR